MSNRNQETMSGGPLYTSAQEQAMKDARAAAIGQACEKAVDPSAANSSLSSLAGTDASVYRIPMTRSLIRKLAQLSPEANRKLRDAAPAAFIGDVIPLHGSVAGMYLNGGVSFRAPDGRPAVRSEYGGRYEGQGLHLDSRYTWELQPASSGVGYTLICREAI